MVAGPRPGGQPDRLHRPGPHRPGRAGGELRRPAARRGRQAHLRDRPTGRPGTTRSRAGTTRRRRPGRAARCELTIDRDLQFEVQRIAGRADGQGERAVRRARSCSTCDRRGAGPGELPVLRRGQPGRRRPARDRGDCATGPWSIRARSTRRSRFGACLQEGVVTPDSTVPVLPDDHQGRHHLPDTHPFRCRTPTSRCRASWPARPMSARSRWPTGSARGPAVRVPAAVRARRGHRRGAAGRVGRSGAAAGATGAGRATARSRSGWASRSPRCRWPRSTPRSPTAACGSAPHLVKADRSRPDGTVTPARRAADPPGDLRRQNAAALRSMLEAVVTVPGATGHVGRDRRTTGWPARPAPASW